MLLLLLLDWIGGLVSVMILIALAKWIIWRWSPLHQIPGPIKDLSLSVRIKGVFEEVEGEAFMKPQERWWKEAGIDTPLIHWTGVFGQHFIMPLDADCVKQVLTSECHINPIYKKNYLVVKKCIGDGLITANGATWHRHRRIIQPAFENKLIENSLNAHVPGIVNRLITSWKTKGTDKDIHISSHFSAIALDILGQVAFSYDFQATNALERWASDMNFSAKPQHPLINALYKELMPNMVRVLLASFNLHHFDDTIIRSSRESRKILNEAVEAVVRKAQLGHSQSKESDNQNCLLNILFDAEDDGHIRHGKRTLSFKDALLDKVSAHTEACI